MEQENNKLDYIEFAVSDIEKTKAFYQDAFGWTFIDFGPTYCEFSDGRFKGGFHTHDPVKTGGALIVIYHSDLKVAEQNVIKAGGVVTKERFDFPGGERFQFTDLDGYELAVWKAV